MNEKYKKIEGIISLIMRTEIFLASYRFFKHILILELERTIVSVSFTKII